MVTKRRDLLEPDPTWLYRLYLYRHDWSRVQNVCYCCCARSTPPSRCIPEEQGRGLLEPEGDLGMWDVTSVEHDKAGTDLLLLH